MQHLQAVIILLCLSSCCRYTHAHWNTTASHAFLRSSECTIARLKASKVTSSVFRDHFLEKTPLIVTDLERCTINIQAAENTRLFTCRESTERPATSCFVHLGRRYSALAGATTRDRLLTDYGHIEVLLSSANTFSYDRKHMLLRCGTTQHSVATLLLVHGVHVCKQRVSNL
jgi:hypothetical protein